MPELHHKANYANRERYTWDVPVVGGGVILTSPHGDEVFLQGDEANRFLARIDEINDYIGSLDLRYEAIAWDEHDEVALYF